MKEQKLVNTSSLTIMGILLIVFGVVAIATPAVAGTAVVLVIGIVLLLSGILQIVSGLRSTGWSSKLPPLVIGILTAICGLGLLGQPWLGMKYITLILAIFFVVEGLWKILASFGYRPARGWLVMLLSGVVTIALGWMIWQQWPISGMWAIGVLVGVDLLTTGISMLALAMTVRHLRKEVERVIDP